MLAESYLEICSKLIEDGHIFSDIVDWPCYDAPCNNISYIALLVTNGCVVILRVSLTTYTNLWLG